MSEEKRIRVFHYDNGIWEVINDENGDRIITSKNFEYVLAEIAAHLLEREPDRTVLVPKMVGNVFLGFGPLFGGKK